MADEVTTLYESPNGEATRLHVVQQDESDVEVWLDTEVDRFDGLVIGVGTTKAEAVADAIVTLEARLAELKGIT